MPTRFRYSSSFSCPLISSFSSPSYPLRSGLQFNYRGEAGKGVVASINRRHKGISRIRQFFFLFSNRSLCVRNNQYEVYRILWNIECVERILEKWFIRGKFAHNSIYRQKLFFSINYFSNPGLILIEMEFDGDRISYLPTQKLF